MSKVKAPKVKGIPSKHLHARTTFLYQAATYLTLQTAVNDGEPATENGSRTAPRSNHSPLALQLGSDLQQVSRKAQLRLSVDLKRSVCKSCNTILVSGHTATQSIENLSRGGRKAWADVLVVECNLCGGKKRFPVSAQRQTKKGERKVAAKQKPSIASSEATQQSHTAL
jgi:ribonuclease P protein subunit RPR2